jgi:drug/metabolite transporter (DMT)-like permease
LCLKSLSLTKSKSDGIAEMVLAMFLFSVMQLLVKKMAYIPFYELIFFRTLTSLIICYFTINKLGISFWGNNSKLLIARGFFGMLSLSCFFYALQRMPLGSLITIVNIKPFLVLLWAYLFLKEPIRWFQWLLFGMSFLCILWLKGVDSRIDFWVLLAAVGAALFASIAHTSVKKLGETENSNVILFYFNLVCVPFFAPISFLKWVVPTDFDLLYCLLIGVITHFAQLLLTKSYQVGKVAVVSNLYYLGIIYAFIFGFFIFGEKYSLQQFLAVFLILFCLILNLLINKKS